MKAHTGGAPQRHRSTAVGSHVGWITLVGIALLVGGFALAQGAAAQAPNVIAEPVDVEPIDEGSEDLVSEGLGALDGLVVPESDGPSGLLIVCEGGQEAGCNTGSIQAAIDFAADGDTIVVRPGTYTEVDEDGNSVGLSINTANVTILAEHAAVDVHDGFNESAERPVFDAGGDDAAVAFGAGLGEVTFEGFKITGNWVACGICQGLSAMEGTSPQIVDNVVHAPEETDRHGNTIQITGPDASVVSNEVSVPHQESPDWTATGILAFSTTNATIEDNTVESSEDDACIAVGGGMFFDPRLPPAVNTVVRKNTIASTAEDRDLACEAGVLVQGAAQNTVIQANTIEDTSQAVNVDEARGDSPQGTSIVDNAFSDNHEQVRTEALALDLDAVLDENGNSFDKALVVRNLTGDIAVVDGEKKILTVIQAGIDLAEDGFEADVREGTYQEAPDVTGVDGIHLNGAGSDAVTVDASDETGRSIAAEYTAEGATDVRLEGFTLLGTSDDYGVKLAFIDGLEVEDVVVEDAHRTAIDLHTVENATLSGVAATGTASGNGIAVRNAVNVTIEGAETSGNAWGGLAFYAPGDETVENALVRDSTFSGEGAGIYAQYSNLDISLDGVELSDNEIGFATLDFQDLQPTDFEVEIQDSTFQGNADAGVLLEGDGGSLDVAENTTFEDNGVGLDVSADFAVVNVQDATFTGNGVAVEHSADTVSTVIQDSTISGNDDGVVNTAENALVDARENYWGSATGPDAGSNDLPTTGDSVQGDVIYRNWCLVQDCTVTASGDVDVRA